MTSVVAAEWRKLTSTRTFAWLLVGAAVASALGTISTVSAASQPPWHLAAPMHEQVLWVLAAVNGSMFAVVAGARVFTDEFRHRTIVHTYLADPSRSRSTIGKVLIGAVAGGAVGLAVLTAALVTLIAMAASSGGTIAFHAADLPAGLGLLTALALWGAVGTGLGAILKHQVAVVASTLVWILMLENLAAGLLEERGRFLPGQAVQALARTSQAFDALPLASAGALMAGYAFVTGAVALVLLRRRDIS